LNGVALKTAPLTNPYRPPGVTVDMTELRRALRAEGNRLEVEVS
jgi:hypothetical protein